MNKGIRGLIISLEPFASEITFLTRSLVAHHHGYLSPKKVLIYTRRIETLLIARLLHEQFLLSIANSCLNEELVTILVNELRSKRPDYEKTFRACFDGLVSMHDMPDTVTIRYDGVNLVIRWNEK